MQLTSVIEDKLIEVCEGLRLWKLVKSAGRYNLPVSLPDSALYIYFDGDRDDSEGPRPVPVMTFAAIVIGRSLASEKTAAKSVYSKIDTLRDALNGKTLGIDGLGAFKVRSRDCILYENGVIIYRVKIEVRNSLPVPMAD